MSKVKPAPLPPDTVIGGYRVVRKLSAGGFGVVYLAVDSEGQQIAVKEYLPASLASRAPGVPFPWSAVSLMVSLVVTTGLFGLLFRVLPDVELGWRDVMTGAFVTAILFTAGQQLIGLYLGQSAMTSSYGAAGSVMILLLWVYYSCQILLFGAEFTRAYAERRGTTLQTATFAAKDVAASP